MRSVIGITQIGDRTGASPAGLGLSPVQIGGGIDAAAGVHFDFGVGQQRQIRESKFVSLAIGQRPTDQVDLRADVGEHHLFLTQRTAARDFTDRDEGIAQRDRFGGRDRRPRADGRSGRRWQRAIRAWNNQLLPDREQIAVG